MTDPNISKATNQEFLAKDNLRIQCHAKQAANSVAHHTQVLIAEVKARQQTIKASWENLFIQHKNIGMEV